jgi:uncharacterized NAD(P)/FAD-binding protein YdhS
MAGMRIDDPTGRQERTRTIAIVGAGFSGTALALHLLRAAPPSNTSVVLIERSGRFGPGLAYGGVSDTPLLNVPAGQMSVDEQQPHDFVNFLQSRGWAADGKAFVPRHLYGQYLETRLKEAARTDGEGARMQRIVGTATSVSRVDAVQAWRVGIDDGRSILAHLVVLATGHSPPRNLEAFLPLASTGRYVAEPWSVLPSTRPAARTLIVGTGLTMADTVCELTARPDGPQEIIAVSRRGLLSQSRRDGAPSLQQAPRMLSALGPAPGLRQIVATVRSAVRDAESWGGSWHDVVSGLRPHTAHLWTSLTEADRRRFLRHVQPYWDVHRHQLPPSVGRRIHELLQSGRLKILAARILACGTRAGRAVVDLRHRKCGRVESMEFDQVINCSGPDGDPRRSPSDLIRSLVADGTLVPAPTGLGVLVDRFGRLRSRAGDAVPGLYYLGPWLRARDWEATAVCELRRQASLLARHLRHDVPLSMAAEPLPRHVPGEFTPAVIR